MSSTPPPIPDPSGPTGVDTSRRRNGRVDITGSNGPAAADIPTRFRDLPSATDVLRVNLVDWGPIPGDDGDIRQNIDMGEVRRRPHGVLPVIEAVAKEGDAIGRNSAGPIHGARSSRPSNEAPIRLRAGCRF